MPASHIVRISTQERVHSRRVLRSVTSGTPNRHFSPSGSPEVSRPISVSRCPARWGTPQTAPGGCAGGTTAGTCAAAALTPSIELLLALRVLQGCGSAACMVVSQAMLRDLLDARTRERVMGKLGHAQMEG